jgi:hypothetical protein
MKTNMFASFVSPAVRSAAAAAAALSVSAIALAHGHITVDTASGTPGDKTIVRVGYQATEADKSITADGTLMQGANPWRIVATTPVAAPAPYAGWSAGNGATLTSDYFYGTGDLAGGDFRFELAAITQLDGSAASATVAWAVVGSDGSLSNVARTDAATRAGRSFTVGAGVHQHGQYVLGSVPGAYRVKIVAWDANGVYADADPVTIEVQVGALPAGDLNGDFRVDGADLGILLGQWGGPGSGDLNGDGRVDGADLGILLGAWR